MEVAILIILALVLLFIVIFFAFYLKNEKRNKIQRKDDTDSVRDLIKSLEAKLEDTKAKILQIQQENLTAASKQIMNDFDIHTKVVQSTHEKYDSHVKSAFDLIIAENTKFQKIVEQQLSNILQEIKTPLDLD